MDTKNNATDRPISIHYVYHSNVTGYRNLGNGTCQVYLNAGWNLLHTTIGSIELQENPEASDAGTVYKTQLVAKHPGHENETPQQVADMSGRRMMLKITYRSGKEKIIGNSSKGPKMFIRTLSNASTTLIVESNFVSEYANLFLAAAE